MRLIPLISVMALLVSCSCTGDLTIRVQDHDGNPFYDAYFVQLQSEGKRIDLFAAFDEDVMKATKVYSSKEFLNKCREVSDKRPRPSIKIVVGYDDFGASGEYSYEISEDDLDQLERGSSVDIQIKLPSEHIDSLLQEY